MKNKPLRIDKDRIALGIRQPWIELILQGIKTIEVRSSETNIRGTIYLYASKKMAVQPFAHDAIEQYEIDVDDLPKGVLVGSVDIVDSAPATAKDAADSCVPKEVLRGKFSWTLANPVRFDKPKKVRFLPYGVWFYPFKRRE